MMSDIETIQESVEEHSASDEVEELKLRQLTKEMLVQGLTGVARTGDGLAHAFTKLTVNGKEIEEIEALSAYPHLRYVVSCLFLIFNDVRTCLETKFRAFQHCHAWNTSCIWIAQRTN